MGSTVDDLLQAVAFARLAALSYFQAGERAKACAILRDGLKYDAAAKALVDNGSGADRERFQATREGSRDVLHLFASRCP